jgi:hypothetical protein
MCSNQLSYGRRKGEPQNFAGEKAAVKAMSCEKSARVCQ